MNRPLFSEINPLYSSGKNAPNVFQFRIRMDAPVDGEALAGAAEAAMKRYPYFCVELKKEEGQYVFADNLRPVTVTHTSDPVALNTKASNFHMLAFAWTDDWIFVEVAHALTDGTGAYALLRTLLYEYASRRYEERPACEGIRLLGDPIPDEEWDDPALNVPDTPAPAGGAILPGLNLIEASKLDKDRVRTVFSVTIKESELMHLVRENDSSPGTIIALFLSRAVASLHPDEEKPIRISLTVNQRAALKAPLAHQSLVGGAWLEYKPAMRFWPLDRQATAYRGMVFVQSRDESVLAGLAAINRNTRALLSLKTDRERAAAAAENADSLRELLTATVSYVGRAGFGGAEAHIRDFHLWAIPMYESLLIEISAVSGCFTLDICQNFSSPVYVDALLKQFEENGIRFTSKAPVPLRLPDLQLPWDT